MPPFFPRDNGGTKAHVALALAGLASVLLAEVFARRLRLPSAVILVVVGLAYGELPGPNLAQIDQAEIDVVTGEVARLRRGVVDAQREELVRWRDAGRLSTGPARARDGTRRRGEPTVGLS
jgi:hypothetical protein